MYEVVLSQVFYHKLSIDRLYKLLSNIAIIGYKILNADLILD